METFGLDLKQNLCIGLEKKAQSLARGLGKKSCLHHQSLGGYFSRAGAVLREDTCNMAAFAFGRWQQQQQQQQQ